MTTLPGSDADLQSQLAYEERQARMRQASHGTELADVTDSEYRALALEQVVLCAVWGADEAGGRRGLAELALLAETAGAQVVGTLTQHRSKPDPGTFLGSGKVDELRDLVRASGADTVICGSELSPGQLRNLEKAVNVKVVDRSWLILDIFAQHATTREGKAQVELAQLSYLLPRLRGWGAALSRQAGGIGTRGPGETKLESDRRHITTKMARLRRELKDLEATRDTRRARRARAEVPAAALVGYTNAGKSSLLNAITKAGVLVDNSLFATLDPTTRRVLTAGGREFTLTDTVGLISQLPHQLVEAFRSTLEEVQFADVTVLVVAASDPDAVHQVATVRATLQELGVSAPELIVLNKADEATPEQLSMLRALGPDRVETCAVSGAGLPLLLERLEALLPSFRSEVWVLIPYERGEVVARIQRDGEVLRSSHEETGTRLLARCGPALTHALAPYLLDERAAEVAGFSSASQHSR